MKALLFFAGTVVTFAAEPALTIYNQNFAVVRETFPIDLKAGDNDTAFSGATALVEPHTVILRDPAGKTAFTVVNQSYRNDPVSQVMRVVSPCRSRMNSTALLAAKGAVKSSLSTIFEAGVDSTISMRPAPTSLLPFQL